MFETVFLSFSLGTFTNTQDVMLALPNPVPNFGLSSPISGSDQVSKVTNQTGILLRTVDDRLNISLTSSYAKLNQTLAQLTTLAHFIVHVDALITAPLLALTDDVSGDVRGRFAPVLAGIAATRAYMDQTLPAKLDQLEALISASVPNRLKDAFGCLRSGLDRLGAALDVLRGALLATEKKFGSGDIPPAVLNKYLTVGTVYDVAKAMTGVKICIPSIVDTIDTTIANLKTADDYILSFKDKLAELFGPMTGVNVYENLLCRKNENGMQ
ncbi:AGAP007272-PA-like protein [Anopheles sinensis]|uniref:AGAP007272-PA-like protein n=1 Tax=Anopheles sinensis TaxID=74873 RepID=A0A084VQT9_ANOSI|nr:AGAP007272-PA-like protein [Anopheles sinensis]